MKMMPLAAALALSLTAFLPSGPAQAAPFHNPAMEAPSLIENVACKTVRSRIVRPNGRVVYRTKRVCGEHRGWRYHSNWRRGRDCRTIRARVVRPNGSVVFRTTRRCR